MVTQTTKILLKTSRLLLRSVDENDREAIKGLYGNAHLMRHIGKPLNDERLEVLLTSWRDYFGQDKFFCGLILDRHSEEVVGLGGVFQNYLPEFLDALEIGYVFHEKHQQKGYGLEITRALLDFASGLSVPRVVGLIHKDNMASQKLFQKAGFQCIGDRFIENHYHEYIKNPLIYEIYMEDWAGSRIEGNRA